MRKSLVLLALAAAPASAQELSYDFSITTACLAGTQGWGEAMECVGTAANACMEATEGGWSTAGQNSCLDAEWQDWDARLNRAYPLLMARLEQEDADMAGESYAPPPQAEALKAMQRAWIPFRDAACAYDASKWFGGTGAGPAALWCLIYETAEQTLRLEADMGEPCGDETCR